MVAGERLKSTSVVDICGGGVRNPSGTEERKSGGSTNREEG